MPAPTLDTTPGPRPGTSAGQRRRRMQLVLVAGALLVVAVSVGVSLAIAIRPVAHQAPAAAGAVPAAAADQADGTGQQAAAKPDQGAAAQPPVRPGSSPAPAAADPPALQDGDHDVYITRIDAAGDRIVVDVVQVFHDGKAVQAAVADGKQPSEARYLTTWVRNDDPRLRSLPLAGGVQIRLRDTCGDPGRDRQAVLAELAANARQDGTYYYTLTVRDGKVGRIQERLAVNAC